VRRDFFEAVHAEDRKYACLLVYREFVALGPVDFLAVRRPDYEHDHVAINLSIGGWEVAIAR
jgi:hypothetical protein